MTHSDSTIPSVLQRIVATKHQEVAQAQTKLSLAAIKAQALALFQHDTQDEQTTIAAKRRGFASALRQADIGIIAEVKKASPSKGIFCHDFDPASIARGYAAAGATCLSVLTDRDYFLGHDDYLLQARNACELPVLRKDFMIDEYQIYESYLLGADCVLLILACLDDAQVAALYELSLSLGMDVLLEVHNQAELDRALALPMTEQTIYGINNRDLHTFNVDLQHSIDLKAHLLAELAQHSVSVIQSVPLIVSESGINTADDIERLRTHDIHHYLIGEQFMKTDNPALALKTLLASIK